MIRKDIQFYLKIGFVETKKKFSRKRKRKRERKKSYQVLFRLQNQFW